MNCFVIMPFAQDFDDVYSTIKTSVELVMADRGKCFRLDEARPAGRITDRLLAELRLAQLCVADLTGTKPNVMWEVGYAMAMGIPTILVTQSLNETPFDIRDMQTIEYDRTRLQRTLAEPLKRVVLDTLAHEHRSTQDGQTTSDVVGELREELSELKRMLAQVVGHRNQSMPSDIQLAHMQGAWRDEATGTHVYVRVVRGQLVAPYCWGGNDTLHAVFFGWKRTGDYWFTHFAWFPLGRSIRGFAFFKEESISAFRGAWWEEDNEELPPPSAPPERQGVFIYLKRLAVESTPAWAEEFFAGVEDGRIDVEHLQWPATL